MSKVVEKKIVFTFTGEKERMQTLETARVLLGISENKYYTLIYKIQDSMQNSHHETGSDDLCKLVTLIAESVSKVK